MSVGDDLDQVHRYSIDEYEELVAKGAFEDQRVELIEGLVLDMSPKSPAHDSAVRWLTEWLTRNVDWSRYQIGIENSIELGRSEAEPDLMVVDRDTPRDRHATSSPLVIEVALSSRERDLTIKPRLYASGVGEYWVLDLGRRLIVVHRDPGPDGYRTVTMHGAGEQIEPQHLELPPLAVDDLLAASC